MTSRRRFLALAAALPASSRALAQSARPRHRVATLEFGAPPPAGAPPAPIERHLAALGYVDGRDVEYLRHYAAGKRDAFASIVAAALAGRPDVVFVAGSDIARTIKAAAPRVPVVFVVSDDPIASGYVQSLARPGGRFTGVSLMSPQLAGKRLEVLAMALPSLKRLAMLYAPEHLAAYPAEMERACRERGIELSEIAFDSPEGFEPALAEAARSRADALFVEPSRYTLAYAPMLAELAIRHRLPAISAYDAFARAGGLVSYGPRVDEAVGRAAAQIVRVLRGTPPADIPVEQPERIALVLNARTARALGIALPKPLLLIADEVIE